jgi:hypothetical protein
MWLLNNATPFAAERTWFRDSDGVEHWLIIIKATFEIDLEGYQNLANEQAPVTRVPVFGGDPASSALIEESDFVLKKTRTDVLLEGHAYAPNARPVEQVSVRMKVGDIDKILNIVGERALSAGLTGPRISAPRPFEKMLICYERSFGGTDLSSEDPTKHAWEPTNPVGVGFGVRMDYVTDKPAPNIEYPNAPYRHHRKGRAAGFGPIARHWSPRVELAGTYDKAWEKNRLPLPPEDFDEAFYQCAPLDQQSNQLMQGYEKVQLVNLTPEGYLEFFLPKIDFRIVTQFYQGPDQNQEAVLHTVRLLPDHHRFQMVWQSSLPCPYDEERLRETSVMLRKHRHTSETAHYHGVWIPG